jgi:hypothetical protein
MLDSDFPAPAEMDFSEVMDICATCLKNKETYESVLRVAALVLSLNNVTMSAQGQKKMKKKAWLRPDSNRRPSVC